MATAYPGGLDVLTNPTSSDTLASPSHSDQHINANDAIEAIEATLGINPEGAYATVAAALLDATPLSGVEVLGSDTFNVDFSTAQNKTRTVAGSVTIDGTNYTNGARATVRLENTSGGAVSVTVTAAVNWLNADGAPTTLADGKVMRIGFISGATAALTDAGWAVEA